MENNPKEDAVNAAADFIKVSTSLSVGALVFGIGYFNNSPVLTSPARIALIIAAIAFVVSTVFGLLAHSRIPVMISAANYNLRDGWLCGLGVVHQLGLGVGGVAIAFGLCFIVLDQPPADQLNVPTASAAIAKIQRILGRSVRIKSLDAIELVRGVDANNLTRAVWHLRMTLVRDVHSQTEDFFIASDTGEITHQP